MIVLQEGMNFAENPIASDLASRLGQALLNSLIGMGIVFVVLIFISFIISRLKYIPKLIEKYTNKNNQNNMEIQIDSEINCEPNVNGAEDFVEISMVDNAELVAVITAAIMASMGNEVSKDGLIVRSIHKIKRSK